MKYSKKVGLFSKRNAAVEIHPTKCISSATMFTIPERVVSLQQCHDATLVYTLLCKQQKGKVVKKKLKFILLPHQLFSNMHLVFNIPSNILLPGLLQTWPSCQCHKDFDFWTIQFSVSIEILLKRMNRIDKVAYNRADITSLLTF